VEHATLSDALEGCGKPIRRRMATRKCSCRSSYTSGNHRFNMTDAHRIAGSEQRLVA